MAADRARPRVDAPAAHRGQARTLRPLTEHPNVARVRAHAAERGTRIEPQRFAQTTRTAGDAAREIGCTVAEIVKSLVFIADDRPIVVLCSGADRVDEQRLRVALGALVARRATADEEKAATGFPIGGVAPFAHARPCRVIADARLLGHAQVWAAAGLPDTVFPIAPGRLVEIAGAEVAAVAAGQSSSSSSSDSNSSE